MVCFWFLFIRNLVCFSAIWFVFLEVLVCWTENNLATLTKKSFYGPNKPAKYFAKPVFGAEQKRMFFPLFSSVKNPLFAKTRDGVCY
jgi:hypothetical protein